MPTTLDNGLQIHGSPTSDAGIILDANSTFADSWADGIAPAVAALGANCFASKLLSLCSAVLNFKTPQTVTLLTVPVGFMFAIDSMEVVTVAITGSDDAPSVSFGNSGDSVAYYATNTTTSNGTAGSRHIIVNPQDGIAEGTVLNASIVDASGATTHTGSLIVRGYLLPTT